VPPLRERRADVLPIARELLARLCAALGCEPPALEASFVEALLAHDWPGNVRELRKALERALLAAGPAPVLSAGVLPRALRREGAPDPGLRGELARVERELIAQALAEHGGVIRAAARRLRMDPVTRARRARRLGLLRGAGGHPSRERRRRLEGASSARRSAPRSACARGSADRWRTSARHRERSALARARVTADGPRRLVTAAPRVAASFRGLPSCGEA
jgi:hypothetical protein